MIRSGTKRERAAVWVALAGVVAACGGGGGGGGGGGPIGPDVTPPGIPVSSLITVDPPIPSALARLSGVAGAVEANAVVNLSNASAAQRTGQPVTASAQASPQGAFSVGVTAQLGDQLQVTATDAAGNTSGVLALKAGPTPLALNLPDPGGDNLTTHTTGEGAFTLPFPNGNERYTLIAQSLNPGPGSFPLTVSGSEVVQVRALGTAAQSAATPTGPEAAIRAFERRVLPLLPRHSRGRRLGLSDDPQVGSTRMFNVVNRFDTVPDLTNRAHFDAVTARLRFKGDHTLIYVDTRAEGPNVTDALLQAVGERFDQQTYEVDRGAFGEETDVDSNGRVIVLMTPTVNGANTDDAAGIFTGFFFGIDLVFHATFNPFSNDAEIFYTVVPDPNEQFSPVPIPVDQAESLLHGVLAHEFEHMINAGGRLETANFETAWLDEGLAHYAETLNDITSNGGRLDFQNTLRSALWLQQPYAWSMVSGEDTVERRGAAWLLVAYLVDRYGQGILRELVAGPLAGIPNVEDKADTSFPFLFYRFTAALLLDGQGISSDPWFDIPSLDVRNRYQDAKTWWAGTNRLPGPFLGIRVATLPGELGSSGVVLKGSTAVYFDVGASAAGTPPVIVRASQQANLQITIIRTQ